MSRNNWKQLEYYSSKTIRLFALNFCEVIIDLAFGLINYHLIEIESELFHLFFCYIEKLRKVNLAELLHPHQLLRIEIEGE